MKINMPVTDNEILMVEGQTLVSKTDLKGAITYVNPAFLAISGFSIDELIGKNHNVVRHPDMPPAAFEDLWNTVKQGRPWTGIIKNRCKNGDYYWVKANVTPIFENGKSIEYMSVRSIPTREEISAAEAAYIDVNSGNLKIKGGNVVKTGLPEVFSKLSDVKISQQFALLGIIFLMLVALMFFLLELQYGQVEFTDKEYIGVEYVKPIRQLLEYIPQHRDMTNTFLKGKLSFETKAVSVRRKIDRLFDEAQKVDDLFGETLDTRAQFSSLYNDWNNLKNNAFSLDPKQGFERHSKLISDLLVLIMHAGDTSNLILDPELGSYYAMDLVINKIPSLTSVMGQVRGLGAGIIAAKVVTENQKARITELRVMLDLDYAGVLTSYKAGAVADERVKERLETLTNNLTSAIGGYKLAIKKMQSGNFDVMDAESYFSDGTYSISSAFALYDESADLLMDLLAERVADFEFKFYFVSIFSVFSIVFASLIGYLLANRILATLRESLENFGSIANGDFSKVIQISGSNELSNMLYALKSMQIKMGFEVEDAGRLAAESARIKNALDVCQTNVMVADNDFNIIYMNEAVQTMFNEAEVDLRQELPEFDASKLLGGNADVFHKNPAHQRQMIEGLRESYSVTIEVGGRTFSLIATPVFDEHNIRLGTAVEWDDQTEELARMAEERRISDANARMKQALDSVSANVMVADADLNIIYMNKAVTNILQNAEEAIRQDLGNFTVSTLIGTNIDIFHKNPAHQRQILENLTSEIQASILVGGRNMDLIVNPIMNEDQQRIGMVVEWSDRTEELIRLAEEKVISDTNARMKQALDTVSANVMVADADRNIIYMNKAVTDTLRDAESDLRKDLSNFSVDNLIGNTIDVFHKNPEHQKRMLENLTSEIVANIVVGGRHMKLVVNPINNDQNERIGTVVEWTDRTNEVAIELEIDTLVNAAANGDLSKRIDPAGKTGFFAKLAGGLNQTVESTDSFLIDMGTVLSAMSEGDLTKTINKDYKGSFGELKLDVNKTINKLTDIITRIRESSGMVHSAANEIYQGNDDLSRRTESQASSLEQTASSMEELTSTVKDSSTNASEANSLSANAKQKAAEGGQVVKGAITAMGEILDSSNKISDIIGVIDEIAFQTNLLALNAAVEAARAGEQGRGFAVVAGEVRTLSQRSAAAAKEIKDLIRDSVSKVESGSQLVNKSGETLGEIVTAIDEVAFRVEGIANAAAEQNAGIGQINQAITQMDDMTQQNAALVEEASAASEALSEQAGVLTNLVGFFNVGGNMSTGVAAPMSVSRPVQQVGASPAAPFKAPKNKAPSQETVIKYSANKGTNSSEWKDF